MSETLQPLTSVPIGTNVIVAQINVAPRIGPA